MSLKKIGIALIASLAIAALGASTASAAVKTVAAQWYVGNPGTTLALGQKRVVNAAIATHPGIGAVAPLKTVIAGTPVELAATGISCVGCEIENRAVNGTVGEEPTTTKSASVIAYGKGAIKFTGVTVITPTNCTVKNPVTGVSGEFETKPLVIHGDWMDTNEANKKAFIDFLPKAGPTAGVAQFRLDGTGCPAITGTYTIFGSLAGESVRNTGERATTQNLVFSPAIQATAGKKLEVGENEAEFTGTGSFSLATGEEFQIK